MNKLTNKDAADASDHEGAAHAIAAGLLEGHSKESPGFWLHTGGTGILTYVDSKADRLGEDSDKIHDDLGKVEELTSLPDDAFHRNVDKIVLEATTKHSDIIKATIVCPPTIYGEYYYSPGLLTSADPIFRQRTRSHFWARPPSLRDGQVDTHGQIHTNHRSRKVEVEQCAYRGPE